MAASAAVGAAAPPARAPLLLTPCASASSSSTLKPRVKDSRHKPKWQQQQQQQQQQQKQQRSEKKKASFGGGFGWVLKKDREFLVKKLEPTKAPLSRFGARFSRAFNDIIWLRYLEEDQQTHPGLPMNNTWPSPSYPGLSGLDLLMADVEALKSYANYLHQISKVWSMPMPEIYDPQKVEVYFTCRPHILAFRVLEVFSSFALAAIKMQTSKKFKFSRNGKEKGVINEDSQYYLGQLLKESMVSLGPTFIKAGQSLSTRPDIIGPEISKALSELHDSIPPFPRSEAVKIVEEELGCPIKDVFSYISEETVAAASFGQVYRGCTVDGCNVAIKVQRPNLLHEVVRDIYILRLGLGLLRKIAKRKSDIRLYADELGKGFVGELDYRLEAVNATDFLEAHSQYSFISVPKVFKHLSRKKVLTMAWLPGENPNELFLLSSRSDNGDGAYSSKQQVDAKKRLLDLVNKGVRASLIQLLETGLLHADPHPGNLRYTQEGQIGFLDFGLLCRMEKKHQLAMLASIMHIVTADWGALVQDLSEMDVVPPRTNIRRVTMDLEQVLGEVVFVDGIPDIKFSRVLGKIWSVALKYHFHMPPYYTLVLRSLASLEGLAVASDPDFKTFQAACPYVVQKLIYDNSSASRRILYSVVFNKKREFQWQRISLFLKIGFTRKSMHVPIKTDTDVYPDFTGRSLKGVDEVANLILRLLSSKDGTIVRRLLMNADSVSLTRTMISNEALFFRQHVSRAFANVIYQWIIKLLGKGDSFARHDEWHSVYREQEREMVQPFPSSAPMLLIVMRDRRMKVVFYKILNSARTDPILLCRFCWTLFAVFVRATALALHLFVVSLSTKYITPSPSSVPRRFAVSI